MLLVFDAEKNRETINDKDILNRKYRLFGLD